MFIDQRVDAQSTAPRTFSTSHFEHTEVLADVVQRKCPRLNPFRMRLLFREGNGAAVKTLKVCFWSNNGRYSGPLKLLSLAETVEELGLSGEIEILIQYTAPC